MDSAVAQERVRAKPADVLRYPFAPPASDGSHVEIVPGLLWLRMPMPMALDHINVYLLRDGDGWAVVEWECCLKHPEDGAREGAAFVKSHIIRVTERAFDDFADSGTDAASLHRMLGI